MVPGEEHKHSSAIPPGLLEYSGRPRIMVDAGQVQLETGRRCIWEGQPTIWSSGGGSIRVEANASVPSLLQLAARSLHGGDGRLPTGLIVNEGICQSTLESNRQSLVEITDARSKGHSICTSVENTAMVSSALVTTGRYPHAFSRTKWVWYLT